MHVSMPPRSALAASTVLVFGCLACQIVAGIGDDPAIRSSAEAGADSGVTVPEAAPDAPDVTIAPEASPADALAAEAAAPWKCLTSNDNGKQYWTCSTSDGNLHECDDAGIPQVESCAGLGCKSNAAGTNDQCFVPSPGWSCAKSTGTDGNQYLTCISDGNLHICEATSMGTVEVQILCPNGCIHNALNTNDTCK